MKIVLSAKVGKNLHMINWYLEQGYSCSTGKYKDWKKLWRILTQM